MCTTVRSTEARKSLKAYVRHDGRRRQVGHLLGRLRSRTLGKKKMDKMRLLVPLGLVCRQSFAGFTTVLLDVKSLVEHIDEK